MNKIEQVARAIAKASYDGYADMARAAIEAMREPTEAMRSAFDEMDAWDDDSRLPTAAEALNAMIDAALKEE